MRKVMIVSHGSRPDAGHSAKLITALLEQRQVTITTAPSADVEMVISLGGDGTLLGAAHHARNLDVPLIGINTGRLGFLTEVESDGIEAVVEAITSGRYTIDSRMSLSIDATLPDGTTHSDWALNEAALLRTESAHPVHIGLGVDGQGVSTYGADGLILATPTGSTAYSFSAGGPVVWPDVEAVVVAPLAAHGLFTRPLVVSPRSILTVTVLEDQNTELELICDGLRSKLLPPGSVVTSTRSHLALQLARIVDAPFSARLVAKFDLPVAGWSALQ